MDLPKVTASFFLYIPLVVIPVPISLATKKLKRPALMRNFSPSKCQTAPLLLCVRSSLATEPETSQVELLSRVMPRSQKLYRSRLCWRLLEYQQLHDGWKVPYIDPHHMTNRFFTGTCWPSRLKSLLVWPTVLSFLGYQIVAIHTSKHVKNQQKTPNVGWKYWKSYVALTKK